MKKKSSNPLYLYIIIAFPALLLCLASCDQGSTGEQDGSAEPDRDLAGLKVERGLHTNSDLAADGYILFNPTNSSSTYLMDREGTILHEWKGYYHSWLAYLMDDGSVIRHVVDPDAPRFHSGGMAGRMDRIGWNKQVLWNFEYATDHYRTHHDIAIMPNGNILAIAWDYRSREELIRAGRKPEYIPLDGLWFDKIIEIDTTMPEGGQVVWEWRFWDHMIQDIDPAIPNYGNPADYPERMDMNVHPVEPPAPISVDSLTKLKIKGWAHRNQTVSDEGCDIFHCNAINYHPEFDQIVFSAPHINEIFIIDHSTTTAEAAGSRGGRYGKGGDFLYRWGNPHNYHRGDSTDQKLFGQHDTRWIQEGYPGAGNLTLYNNVIPGPDSTPPYSAIFELELPIQEDGLYSMLEDGTFGPEEPVWKYIAPDTISMFSPFTSGAMRLKNGNTFILQGVSGRMLEVTSEGETAWEYWNPYKGNVREPNGDDDSAPFHFWLFRSTFIPSDHPGLVGKELTPLDPQPEPFVLTPTESD